MARADVLLVEGRESPTDRVRVFARLPDIRDVAVARFRRHTRPTAVADQGVSRADRSPAVCARPSDVATARSSHARSVVAAIRAAYELVAVRPGIASVAHADILVVARAKHAAQTLRRLAVRSFPSCGAGAGAGSCACPSVEAPSRTFVHRAMRRRSPPTVTRAGIRSDTGAVTAAIIGADKIITDGPSPSVHTQARLRTRSGLPACAVRSTVDTAGFSVRDFAVGSAPPTSASAHFATAHTVAITDTRLVVVDAIALFLGVTKRSSPTVQTDALLDTKGRFVTRPIGTTAQAADFRVGHVAIGASPVGVALADLVEAGTVGSTDSRFVVIDVIALLLGVAQGTLPPVETDTRLDSGSGFVASSVNT